MKSLLGHKGPVNAAAFEPQSGEIVASVCNNSCRIWHLNGQQQACIALRSPGTAALWHPDDHGKLLVAEKWGTLRLYNAMTKPALSIMSLETGQAGLLLSADWSLSNSLLLGAVAGPHCFLWETGRSSWPLDQKPVHHDGTTNCAFSHIQEEMCATHGHPGNVVNVHNLRTAQVAIEALLQSFMFTNHHHTNCYCFVLPGAFMHCGTCFETAFFNPKAYLGS
ncbi:nucleoporin Nup37-like isoform X2 [Amblyomma americanum]